MTRLRVEINRLGVNELKWQWWNFCTCEYVPHVILQLYECPRTVLR